MVVVSDCGVGQHIGAEHSGTPLHHVAQPDHCSSDCWLASHQRLSTGSSAGERTMFLDCVHNRVIQGWEECEGLLGGQGDSVSVVLLHAGSLGPLWQWCTPACSGTLTRVLLTLRLVMECLQWIRTASLLLVGAPGSACCAACVGVHLASQEGSAAGPGPTQVPGPGTCVGLLSPVFGLFTAGVVAERHLHGP